MPRLLKRPHDQPMNLSLRQFPQDVRVDRAADALRDFRLPLL